ncbi:MAG: hypothetical protein M3024_04885 [Candidatus Dormibacteraeota bacterium]|nr:hypothetical protein [Candidatus Dormibacteraeota bacterium]
MPPPDDAEEQMSEASRMQALVAAAARSAELQPRERERILRAAATGDEAARQALLQSHLDLVAAAAGERADRGLSSGDLFQEGAIGLLGAIGDYATQGTGDFEGFARRRVAEAMEKALAAESDCVDQAYRLVGAAEDYERVGVGLRRELGQDPTVAQIAEKLEWTPERTIEIARLVDEARRRHDEELLSYLDPDALELESDEDDPGSGPVHQG